MRSFLSAISASLAVLMTLAISAVHASAPQAGTCVTCLGPQTNTLWQGDVPLGGFTRYGTPLTKNLRLEVLFIDDPNSDASRAFHWPLVKALDAFGSWHGVQPAPPDCVGGSCFAPSFDFSHASYRSRYAIFVRAPIVSGLHCNRRLPREAKALLKHEHWNYFRPPRATEPCWYPPDEGHDVPMLLAGGYVQVGIQIVTPSLFESGTAGGLPFATVHDALARNQPTAQVTQGALYAVNAEANIIEALICHADGMQPRGTCGRAVIKKLLKHVR